MKCPGGEPMTVICAWCKKVLKGDPNGELVSHGICEKCAKEMESNLDLAEENWRRDRAAVSDAISEFERMLRS